MTFSIGLDIGGTKIHGAVIDGDCAIVAEVRRPTEAGAEGVVRGAAAVVDELRAAVGAPVTTVGVGVPGLVDPDRGTVTHAVNLGLDGDRFPLADLLAQRLSSAVVVDNDVNVATLGAHALTGADDLAYLSIGTGLAAGLMLGGVLRRGDRGAAGEVGHIPLDPAGAECACGQRGCLETVVSGSALAAAWPSARGVPPAQALFAAADAGDPGAIAARDRFAAGAAAAVRVLGLTADPRLVVLGGGVSTLGEPLRAVVADALDAQARSSAFLASLDLAGRVRVLPAGVPVAALGAAMLGRA